MNKELERLLACLAFNLTYTVTLALTVTVIKLLFVSFAKEFQLYRNYIRELHFLLCLVGNYFSWQRENK